MRHCRYPNCRSKDIHIMYLDRPLCAKHWQKIAEMPLEKVRGCLKLKPSELPFPASTTGAARGETPEDMGESVPSECMPRQMIFFTSAASEQSSEGAQQEKGRRRTTRKKKDVSSSDVASPVIQRSLFGEMKEEAS